CLLHGVAVLDPVDDDGHVPLRIGRAGFITRGAEVLHFGRRGARLPSSPTASRFLKPCRGAREAETMSDEAALLTRMYREFNARNVDALLDVMDADANWPNGWEGGSVVGHDAVRDYWTRQWAEIDPTVTPQGFEPLADGRLRVRVHQVIRDRAGKLMSDKAVHHTYSFAAGKISGMVIEAAA